jgi:UDP-3-O-[3-hydroxymyristoyl] glucosamine N-acyltransferase
LGFTLQELAEFLGARLAGDANLRLDGVGPLDSATARQLSFLSNPKYLPQLASSKAGAFILSQSDADKIGAAVGRNLLISDNPYRDFALTAARYSSPRFRPDPGVHPGALIAADAVLGRDVAIGAFCVVEKGAVIGARTALHPFSYIGAGVKIGEDCALYPFATVLEGCVLGHRVILQSGAVIGADGFGFAPDPPKGYVKVPQIGNVVIEDDVEIQANACVDRGALGATRVGRGSKIDNLVQIAHNVQIGEHSVFAAQAGISGSTKVGNWVTFAGQSASAGHLNIGDRAIVTGQAGAGKDVPPGAMVSGSPAVPTLEHHRGLAELNKLSNLKKRVKELEARLAALEKALDKKPASPS